MLVLFDNSTPRTLARYLITHHAVTEARARGWGKEGNHENRDRRPIFRYCGKRRIRQWKYNSPQTNKPKLSRMAEAQGLAAEALVQEAVDRLLNYDEWFSREVDKGLAAANRGEFIEHDDVGKMIESRYPAE